MWSYVLHREKSMPSTYTASARASNSFAPSDGEFSSMPVAGPLGWELPLCLKSSHQGVLPLGYEISQPCLGALNHFHFPNSKELAGQLPVFHRNSDALPSPSDDVLRNEAAFHETLATADENSKPLSNGLDNFGHFQFPWGSECDTRSQFIDYSTCGDGFAPTPLEEWKPPKTVISADGPLDDLQIVEYSPLKAATDLGKPRRSKVIGDLVAAFRHQKPPETLDTSDESSGVDNNHPRSHYLYRARRQADGLYHCPWEGKDGCKHEADRLKCNYDKFVDAHLKPFCCRVPTCNVLPFASTPSLLRHEREAHAMHGHGERPFLCTYDYCYRSLPGNGFPRHWNLRDHMKRMHNDSEPPKSSAFQLNEPTKSKKRKSGSTSQPKGQTKNKRPRDRTDNLAGPTKRKKSKADKADKPKKQTKNTKLEAEITDTSPVDTVLQSSSTSPTIVGTFQEQLELYHQNEEKLLGIVRQVHDPRNPSNVALLRDTVNCIKVMARIAQHINAVSRTKQ